MTVLSSLPYRKHRCRLIDLLVPVQKRIETMDKLTIVASIAQKTIAVSFVLSFAFCVFHIIQHSHL